MVLTRLLLVALIAMSCVAQKVRLGYDTQGVLTPAQGGTQACVDAGSTDAYTCTLSPSLAAYVNNMTVLLKPNTDNTGACALAIDGLASTPIVKADGTSTPDDGEIVAGGYYILTYDGASFRMSGFGSLDPALFSEISKPEAPASNKLKVYAKDISGVTYFCAQNADGKEVCIAPEGIQTDSTEPTVWLAKQLADTLEEPASGYTNFGFKVTTGVPVYRVHGGVETEAGSGDSLPSQAGNGGMVLTTDGADAAWAREIDKTRWIARMRDNFMRHTAASGSLGWTQGGTSGAGADGTSSSATFEHPGVYTYYAVYAGADKHTYLYLGYIGALGSNANWEVYYTFRTDPYQSTQGAYRIGFVKDGQEGANPPTDWFGLRYWNSSTCATNATDSYWTYEARAASTSTTSATATAQTTNQWLTVRMRSTTAGTIKFSLSTDDGETFSAETDIATNIPTDNLRPFVQRWGCTADTYYRVLMDEFMYEAWR